MGIMEDAEPLVGKNNAPSMDIKDEFNYLSTLEDQDFNCCYSTITNSYENVFEFIKEHDCFLNLPEVALEEHPLNIEAIKAAQQEDEELRKWKNNNPNCYFTTKIGKVKNVLCYCKPGLKREENWKLFYLEN